MNRTPLLLVTALSLAVATPVLAQGGGGGGGAGGGAGGASGSSASSGAGTGTSSSANGGPSAPSGMGTNATTTGVHTNNSAMNPNVQPPTPNGTAPANGSNQTANLNGTDRSGITATNGANNANGRQMSPAEQARTGVKTLPQDQTPGAVSAPGVGVGHAANGLPIGTPGSGTSNVDQK